MVSVITNFIIIIIVIISDMRDVSPSPNQTFKVQTLHRKLWEGMKEPRPESLLKYLAEAI